MDNKSGDIYITNGIIITPFKILKDQAILIRNGKIISIENKCSNTLENVTIIDARGNYIVPGFIDLHVHGGGGADTMDGSYSAIKKIADTHCCYGTTSFLATTMTMGQDEILNSLKTVKEANKKGTASAHVLGIHLEGPYISEVMKGAQNKAYIKKPAIEELQEFNKASGSLIKIVTLAPEIPGALDLIRWLKKNDIIASVGHTNATYEQVKSGIDAGLQHVTHTFNAMTGLHHRKPGAVGAALVSPELIIELIADGIHIHPAVMEILFKSKGTEKIILITDAIRATGLPPGRYELGGQAVIASKNKARLEDGTLAGSVLTMDRAIRNMVRKVKVPLVEAIQMATFNPAKCLGIEGKKGSISQGKDADIVILNKKMETELTIVMGKVIFNKKEVC